MYHVDSFEQFLAVWQQTLPFSCSERNPWCRGVRNEWATKRWERGMRCRTFVLGAGVGVRRRSFDSGEIKRAADGGASIDCCCNYSAILAQSQMKLFRTELAADANAVLHLSLQHATTFWTVKPSTKVSLHGFRVSRSTARVVDALLHTMLYRVLMKFSRNAFSGFARFSII